jgi:hypothetical protein
MFFAFVLLLFITLGGFVVTYFYDEDAPFFVRLCAGAVIGQVLFSLVSFVVGSFAGMSPALFALSAVISTLPLLAWTRQTIRTKIAADFSDFFARVRTFFLRPTLGQSIWSAVWVALLTARCSTSTAASAQALRTTTETYRFTSKPFTVF